MQFDKLAIEFYVTDSHKCAKDSVLFTEILWMFHLGKLYFTLQTIFEMYLAIN